MATFALVHGAWHGAWCWDALAPLLVEAGHDVVAVDLPSDDPDVSFSSYADVVVEALAERSDIVLVGHSLAGLTVPLVAARREVRALVYVCALLPVPGRSFRQLVSEHPAMLVPGYREGLALVDDRGSTRWRDPVLARATLFADCTAAVAKRGVERLRPQATTPYDDPCPLAAMPGVPTTYVLCREDRLVSPEWSRRVAAQQVDRLVELPGGHSPFLSRPSELAAVLLEGLPG